MWQFPKWPGLEPGHAAFQLPGPTLAAPGAENRVGGGAEGGGGFSGRGGGEVWGTCWQGPAMFSEAQTSGSITQCDGEKCLMLMKASSVSLQLDDTPKRIM